MTQSAHPDRSTLRRQLLEARRAGLAQAPGAEAHLASAVRDLITQLEPQCLGLYWPLEGEFNAAAWALEAGHAFKDIFDMQLALPFARKEGRQMAYRRWDGQTPRVQDECGIASSDGAVVLPDVILVPCVGYTREGYRLGYGGGYFDRYLAAHPGATTVGLAWSWGETQFAVEAHDRPLSVILTERELIAP